MNYGDMLAFAQRHHANHTVCMHAWVPKPVDKAMCTAPEVFPSTPYPPASRARNLGLLGQQSVVVAFTTCHNKGPMSYVVDGTLKLLDEAVPYRTGTWLPSLSRWNTNCEKSICTFPSHRGINRSNTVTELRTFRSAFIFRRTPGPVMMDIPWVSDGYTSNIPTSRSLRCAYSMPC